jgi:ParB-like chromosome segregation protein Spo0J
MSYKHNALPGKRTNVFMVPPEELTIVGRDVDEDGNVLQLDAARAKRKPNPKRVRTIVKHGVMQPITVRKNGERIEVVFGKGRVIDAREANRLLAEEGVDEQVMVPCRLEKNSDPLHLFAMMVIENEQRDADDPLAKAEKASHMRRLGADDEAVADAFNVDVKTARSWDDILSLAPEVKKAIRNEQIDAYAALNLRDFTQAEQVTELKKLIAEAGGKKVTGKKAKVAARKKKDPNGFEPAAKKYYKKLVKSDDFKEKYSEEMIKGMRLVLGELNHTSVGGLVDQLREVGWKG